MTKQAITAYLQDESKTVGNLICQFNRLKLWNGWLQKLLPEESVLLQHCQIVGLDKTSLIVIADNPHWVTRFRFFIPDLLIQLRQYDDLKNIKSICCKTRPALFRATKSKRKPLIISEQTAETIKETAERIKSEKLKTILIQMAKRTMAT